MVGLKGPQDQRGDRWKTVENGDDEQLILRARGIGRRLDKDQRFTLTGAVVRRVVQQVQDSRRWPSVGEGALSRGQLMSGNLIHLMLFCFVL